MSDLNTRLLAAHERGDRHALVSLYRDAASQSEDEDARGFFLTQSYVFALETGHPAVAELRAELVAMGRETAG